MQSVISSFQNETAKSLGSLSSLVHLALVASGIENNLQYKSVMFNGSSSVLHYSPAPTSFNSCACSVAPECDITNLGFWCTLGNNCTAGSNVWTVPGLTSTCTHYGSMLAGDLRCFYNRTCFDKILSLYNVDMPHRISLPSLTRSIPILDASAPSRFSPTDNLGTLFEQLMVEEWNIQGDFNGYYEACAPTSCTYVTIQRLSIIDLVTTIVGLIGGLSISLRLLIELTTRIISAAILYWQSRGISVEDREPNTSIASMSIFPM